MQDAVAAHNGVNLSSSDLDKLVAYLNQLDGHEGAPATPNSAPTLTNPGSQAHTVGDAVSLQLSANDPDGDSLTYSASGLPAGLSVNSSGRISGTVSRADSYSVSATVVDGRGGTDSVSFTWVISEGTSAGSYSTRIDSDSEDAEQSASGSTYTDSSDLDMGSYAVGLRFKNVNVPPGAVITNAYIQFMVDEADSETTSLTISAHDTDNAPGFVNSYQNITSRPKTSAQVNWSVAAWTTVGEAGPNQRTPNLKNTVQEIVNRGGWSAGNNVVFMITGSGNRAAESYKGSSTGAPYLHIDFTTTGGNQPPLLSNPGAQASLLGTPVSLQLNASDANGDSLSYSVNGLPPGLSVNSSTGQITGATSSAGSYTVTATVRDAQGGSDDVSFSWTVYAGTGATGKVYVSSSTSGVVGGVSFNDEDILVYTLGTNTWEKYLDGSDVGLTKSNHDIDALYIDSDGSILFSILANDTLPDIGDVNEADIIRFIPTSLGETSAGRFELYFDGSDVALDGSHHDIDAFHLLENGDLILSTKGSYRLPGLSGSDEDLLRFSPSSLGATTSGTFSLYFDGSDVGLNETNYEDVYGASMNSGETAIYLSTRGEFDVPGISAYKDDVFACTPTSLGASTACSYSMFLDSTVSGFTNENIDGLHVSD